MMKSFFSGWPSFQRTVKVGPESSKMVNGTPEPRVMSEETRKFAGSPTVPLITRRWLVDVRGRELVEIGGGAVVEGAELRCLRSDCPGRCLEASA